MKAVITPRQLHGSVSAIASKSQAHRMLICAALADAPSRIYCRELSRDIEATAECLRALGCRMDRDEENGYHLFTPCGGNPFDLRATTLEECCADWQITYLC